MKYRIFVKEGLENIDVVDGMDLNILPYGIVIFDKKVKKSDEHCFETFIPYENIKIIRSIE